jgi:hypothetical protein
MKLAWLATDEVVQPLVILFAVVVIIQYSSVFEQEYHTKLINLYMYPWWRMLIIFLVISAAVWNPRIGILVAVVVFFYLSDMNTLITPFPSL